MSRCGRAHASALRLSLVLVAFGLASVPFSITLSTPAQGSPVGAPLLSAATAKATVERVFPVWQSDLHQGKVKQLPKFEEGVQLDLDTLSCTLNIQYTPCGQSPMLGMSVVVPTQYHYPLRFLAEIKTDENTVTMTTSTATSNSAALELIVFTKSKVGAPWLISFETSLYSTTYAPPPFLPAAPNTESNGLTPAISAPMTHALEVLPAELADYWQAWKTEGGPPQGTKFVPGPFTTSFGSSLATSPDGNIGTDLRQVVQYSSNPSVDGAFVFSVGMGEFTSNPTPGGIGYEGTSGYLVCSPILVSIDLMPDPGGPLLVQDTAEVNFGPGLAPGRYASILDESVHESCVLTDGDGDLSALGADGAVYAQFGSAKAA